MKRISVFSISILIFTPFLLFLNTFTANAETLSQVIVEPVTIVQGDPVLITITTGTPTKVILNDKKAPLFKYLGKYRALLPIDINQKVGLQDILIFFSDGSIASTTIDVIKREKIELPLGIPEKLGGNTATSAQKLVSNLSVENASITNTKTGIKSFWTKPFHSPLSALTITDPYGYNRKTGEYTIAHKGTDFHAVEGTKVYAMNRGVVRIAHNYTIYGKTIIVDHGLGLSTLYMHLSKIYVNVGELVLPGQLIGLSGKTGYADMPHLHLSIKIGGISIDPVVFMKFFDINI